MIVLFIEGRFGEAVAALLESKGERIRVLPRLSSIASLGDALDGADFAVAALWRRYPREVDALDAACHQKGVRWTSVVLEDIHLRCGPLINPYTGPCHKCYRTRWLTHLTTADREETLDAVYATAPHRGIAGFTPSTVGMAVALLLMDYAEPAAVPGRLRRVDLLSCEVKETRVIQVHGCNRCSASREPGERYVRDLVSKLNARSS